MDTRRRTLTFLFSDVERSTALLERMGSERYAEVLERQAEILSEACSRHGGEPVDFQGDGCFFVFTSAAEAVTAAATAQQELASELWPEPLRVRIGLHTGEATVLGGRYVGIAVHRAARICQAAHGGQVLVSATTREIAADALPPELPLDELGARSLKGLSGRERLFVLAGEQPLSQTAPGPAARGGQPPATPPAPAFRIADADRERVATLLRHHCVQGRLTLEEFSERLDELYAAGTDGELAAVLRELPEAAAPLGPRRKRRSWLVTLFGSEQRHGPWQVGKRIFAFSLIGSPDLDFRDAVITSDEVRITSIALIGSLTATVPAGVEVDLGGFCLIGGNDFATRADVPAIEGGPRLRIRCFSLLGGAAITHFHASADDAEQAALTPRQIAR